MFYWILLFTVLFSGTSFAKEITTNEIRMSGAPSWLEQRQIEKVGEDISRFLEWTPRRVKGIWHSSQKEFQKEHGLDGSVLAFTRKTKGEIHFGPKVNSKNFKWVFGHELVHVILGQKYKKAIPSWVEEGLANYASRRTSKPWPIDFKWLSQQKSLHVSSLNHPFQKGQSAKFHYMLSTAAMLLLVEKCDIHDLLQMSVGKRLEKYLSGICGMKDIDSSLEQWIKTKAASTNS